MFLRRHKSLKIKLRYWYTESIFCGKKNENYKKIESQQRNMMFVVIRCIRYVHKLASIIIQNEMKK